MSSLPWASGPKEILQHGLALLHKDSDANRRLALLSIDNAIELTIKTFLGLPKRISGIEIPRKEYAEFSESFPRLLDALEKYAEEKLDGIDLGEIEWFHRLRNQLYHQGNGLTVDREKVEIYSELAKLIFRNLFESDLEVPLEDQHQLLGDFLASWVKFEQTMTELAENNKEALSTIHGRTKPPFFLLKKLYELGKIEEKDIEKIEKLRKLRNDVVHSVVDYKEAINSKTIKDLKEIIKKYKQA